MTPRPHRPTSHRPADYLLPLRGLRERAGLPREHLAVRAATTSRTLYRLESSPSAWLTVSLGLVRQIATSLNVPVVTLCPWLGTLEPFPPSSPGGPEGPMSPEGAPSRPSPTLDNPNEEDILEP